VNFEGAFRHSDVKDRDSYDTWKFGGDWEPVSGFRLRAMKARAVRSPVPNELTGIGDTFGVINDPCTAARRNNNPTRAANCATDGVPADYAPPLVVEQSVAGKTGGNPDLSPEKGTTLTYGFVWQPSFVKGFALTVDRFEIDVKDIITTVNRQTATNLCYDTTGRLFCNALSRGTNPLLPGANYVLTSVNEQYQNSASLKVNGVDVQLRYGLRAGGYGDVDLSLVTTIYDKATLVPLAGEDAVDLLGQAGGSTGDLNQGWIRVTANGNIGWKRGPFRANWNLRYIGPADMALGTTEDGFPKIGSATYHNVRMTYSFGKGSEAYFGISNLFDRKPPFFATGTSGTQALDTVPGYYDVFGRSYFAGVRLKF
jgi:outer membrane receptor protein involved in Fe transport